MVNTVSGIKTLRANSWEGRSGVYIDFELSTNMDKAMQELRDKVALVRPRFPKEAKDPYIARAEGDNERAIATLVEQRDGLQTARPVEVVHEVPAGGLKVDEQRHTSADHVKVVQGEINAEASRNCKEMDDSVCRATYRGEGHDRVVK